jgi:predicted transcriptional regulator of viral defense system
MTNMDAILAIARKKGVLRIKDVREAGFHSEYVRRLCRNGELVRMSRGVYILADADVSADIGLAAVAKRVPNGVMCLLTALRYHGIGTQLPFEVWVAIDYNAHRPQIENPKTRLFRFSGEAFSAGAEVHTIDGVPVKIYDPAKTVADCFKFRNKVGLDVALEALKDVIQNRKCSVDQLVEYARVCRVSKVMSPYMEAML